MSKTKIIIPSVEAIEMLIQRYIIPSYGAYEAVRPTTSSMYDPYSHIIEYRSYRLSIS